MLRSFKTEISPSQEQAHKIACTIGTCRFIYNLYLSHNKELYEAGGTFMTAYDFSLWMNHVYIPSNPDKAWIKEVSSKAVKKAIMNAEAAYKRFFKSQSKFPVFKKKGKSDPSMYFVNAGVHVERHRIKIPTLGWVKLKEKGYIPSEKEDIKIKSGTVSVRAGRYYVSVLIEMPDPIITKAEGGPIGIDLGLKDFATVSNGHVYKNVNKTGKMRKLDKKLKRETRRLSRMMRSGKRKKRGKNIEKQKEKVRKIHQRMDNIRTDCLNKCLSAEVKAKPSHITIEDLNVSGMMKNRHLAKAVASGKFYEFRQKAVPKCRLNGVELRVVSRWYPSSKKCHGCGSILRGLKLSDRIYRCPVCGLVTDRDYNASLNLRDAEEYEIII